MTNDMDVAKSMQAALLAETEKCEIAAIEKELTRRREEAGIVLKERPKKGLSVSLQNRFGTPRQQPTQGQIRQKAWNALCDSRGSRYANCRLGTFLAQTPEQSRAIESLSRFCRSITENVRSGRGLVLFGPRGTGKDHLAMAVCRQVIANDFRVVWQNGMDLFGDVRDAIDSHDSERSFVDRLIRPDVLYISDPLPPIGSLTDFQSAMLFRVLDARYSRSKPLICTVNVSNRDELDRRLGPQNSDRLRDGALAVHCKWESYRRTVGC